MINNFSAKEAEFDERVMKLARGVDEFEGYQNPHASLVADLADAIAQKFNLAVHDRYSLRQAALVHDIGMPVMNRKYIKSNRTLSEDERIDMHRHTIIGEQEAAKRGLSRAVQLLVRWHHEWWNGAGYPDALEGKQIPLTAAILRVADTYASMTASRSYRETVSDEEARLYLKQSSGIEFDPKIIKVFLSLENNKILQSASANSFKPEKNTELATSESFSIFNPS